MVEREEGKKKRRGASLIYTAGDMVAGKGELNGVCEYGCCCLGNRYIDHTIAYDGTGFGGSGTNIPPLFLL